MNWIIENYNEVLQAIGAVVSAATLIVALTPSTKDDAVLGKIILFIEKFSVIAKRTK